MTRAALLAVALASACATPAVDLPRPPSPADSVDARRAYYEAHRPASVLPSNALRPGYVLLADGTRVDRVDDLVRVVEPWSPTAEAARRADEARARAAAWRWTTTGVGFAALGLKLVDTAVFHLGDHRDPAVFVAWNAASIGSLALMGVAAATSFVAVAAQGETMMEEDTARLTFDRSLRERLALVDDDATE